MTDPIAALAEQYATHFKERLGRPRTIGRELEFPVVKADGTAGDVRHLWPHLMAGGDLTPKYDDPESRSLIVALQGRAASYEIEVGHGTVEVVVGPCEDLFQLEAVTKKAVARLVRAATAEGLSVLGFGIQPRTPRSVALMTPKKRYGALLKAIGAPWLHFATTAADQVQIDITRDELLPMLNWMNFLSGPLIALAANSSVYGGRAGQFVSGREGLLGTIGQHRNGMTPRRFASLEEFIAFICGHPCYVLKDGDAFRPYQRPFTHYLAKHGPDFQTYLWHEHYTWNSARARTEHSTIEIRPACQQPQSESLAASALSLGFVEAAPAIAEYVERVLGVDPWPTMLRYRKAVIHDGLRAQEPVKKFLSSLVQEAENGLRRRGRGEETFLGPIWARLEERRAPADRARALFVKKGMPALIEACRWNNTD